MVSLAVNALGSLDVLVNNAGIPAHTAPVEQIPPHEWEKVVQVNLNCTFNVTRLAIPHLKKSRAGVIIIMSCIAGRFGCANRSPYSTTSGGSSAVPRLSPLNWGNSTYVRMPSCLARYGSRVSTGARRSSQSYRSIGSTKRESLRCPTQSLKRFVDPSDIAALAVFLASDAAKSIFGPDDSHRQRRTEGVLNPRFDRTEETRWRARYVMNSLEPGS